MEFSMLFRSVGLLFVVILVAGCSGGGSGSSSNTACSNTNEILVTGTITYDLVPHNTGTNALDYGAITQEPVKGAVVEMRCGGLQYASAVTDATGAYSLNASAGVNNSVRVYAQMLDTSAPGTWNFQVVDNTASGALYAMEGGSINSTSNITGHNLNAASGWGGSSYTSTRVAAPFAILDSVYESFQKVLSVDSSAVFPALNINWSVNNVAISGDKTAGQITTSLFDGSAIYILGSENSDTDEYDDHVIIHEWGHYFEYNFSRTDSIGGSHSLSDILDIRLAFGEGFGNAYSGIASGDSVYRDSSGTQQGSGFSFDVDSNSCAKPGWYSECSVQSLLYDFNTLFGFSALYTVLTNEQKNTVAVTSIFSFVKGLKNNVGSEVTIDGYLTPQNIDSITDIYGDSETTNNPGTSNQLPVHTTGTATNNICTTNENGSSNKLGVHRFIRFNFAGSQSVTFTATKTSGLNIADPDLILYKQGNIVGIAEGTTANSETLTVNVTAGDYVLNLREYNYVQAGGTPAITCYTISRTP